MSTIKISELATNAISLTDFFAKADASGLASKNNIQGLSNFLNTVGTLAFRGVLLAADAAVTLDGIYVAGDAGTYTNNGGLVITVSNQIVLISVTGTQTVFEQSIFPITLTIDATPTEGSVNAAQSGGIKDYIDNGLNKKANLIVGKNLLDYNNRSDGFRLNTGDGSLITAIGYTTTPFIAIEELTDYVSNRYTWVVFYDANKSFISSLINAGGTTFETVSGAAFVRYADGTIYFTSEPQFELGTVATSYIPYSLLLETTEIRDFAVNSASAIESKGFVKPIIGKNLYNKATNTIGSYVDNSSGNLVVNAAYNSSDFISVNPSTLHQITYYSFISFYTESKVFISNGGAPNSSFTTPSNAYFVRFSDIVVRMLAPIMLEVGSVITNFQDYQIAIENKYINKNNDLPTIVTASRYGSADFVGRRAIQDAIDSITDASIINRYEVKVLAGVYEATQTSHFDKTNPGNCFIQGKDFVDIKGIDRDNCVIKGVLPNNLGSAFAYSTYQPIYWNCNANLENLTVIGENIRYPVHLDGSQLGGLNYDTYIKNCTLRHNGNTGDAVNWASWTALGLGLSDGQKLLVENTNLESSGTGSYAHSYGDFKNSCEVTFKRCKISNNNNGATDSIAIIQSLGSGLKDRFILDNCQLGEGTFSISSTPWIPTDLDKQKVDHAEFQVIADTSPKAVNNHLLNGKGLRITSKTTGASSTVRFDETSTAFNLIAGNSLSTYEFENRYFRKEIYKYQYKDGGNSLKGYAIGGLDIGEDGKGSNSAIYITNLGKRLDDCSTVNKTLSVLIDGVNYNVVFDKNYNGTSETVLPNYSNATIIAEIVAVIGGVADVEEYVVGSDYYPQFNDTITSINEDSDEILSGMGVVFSSIGKMRKALNSDNRIDGVCLYDCRVGDKSIVIKKGEIFSNFIARRFKIQEISTATRLVGVQLGMSATAGVFDVLASPKLLITTSTDIVKII